MTKIYVLVVHTKLTLNNLVMMLYQGDMLENSGGLLFNDLFSWNISLEMINSTSILMKFSFLGDSNVETKST